MNFLGEPMCVLHADGYPFYKLYQITTHVSVIVPIINVLEVVVLEVDKTS